MRSLFVFVVCVCLAACGTSSNGDSAPFETLYVRSSNVERNAIDHGRVAQLRTANTESALRFYRELRNGDENLVFSPLSFSRVFSGYYDGVHEAAAFEALFGFTPEVATYEAWEQLMYLATDRSEFDDVDPDDRSRFEASDVRWVDEGSGEAVAQESYDRVHLLPIKADPEGATKVINQWVEDTSYGMLVDFLLPGVVNGDTAFVETNVVFFLGAWPATYGDRTVAFDGGAEVPAFGGTSDLSAGVSDDGVTVLRLPYAHRYHHLFLMPDEDFDGFAEGLDGEHFRELLGSMRSYEVTFVVPEFSVDSRPEVVGAIDRIRRATGTTGATLTKAYDETYAHMAAMEFTKEGTRAAAASAIIGYDNSVPEPLEPLTVVIDKPFVHAVIDDVTQSILFLGEVTAL